MGSAICGCVEMGRKPRFINDIGIDDILINGTPSKFEYKKKNIGFTPT